MKIPSLFARGLACIAAFALVATAPAATAPKFSDPDVTAFAQSYSDLMDEYAAAVKTAKSGDTSKVQALMPKLQEIQTKGTALAGKVKPEEVEKFQKFMMDCMQRLTDAAK